MRASVVRADTDIHSPQGARDCAFTNGGNLNHVPGINYVIDTGLARISRYSIQQNTKTPDRGISKASANQRKGRCGRLAEGFCIRLYSEAILKALSLLIRKYANESGIGHLRMLSLKIGDITKFLP